MTTTRQPVDSTRASDARVIINGNIFLYREKAPFVPSGVSIQGALEYDPADDKIRCHECGEWYQNLGVHVFYAHGATAAEYKKKHGLRFRAALVSERIRAGQSERGTVNRDRFLTNPNHPSRSAAVRMRIAEQMRRQNPARHAPGRTAEYRNEHMRCHAQLLDAVQRLASALKKTPSYKDLIGAGISPAPLMNAFNVPTVNGVMALLGMKPNPRLPEPRYTPELLTELLRKFHRSHGRIATMSDFRRGLLPDMTIYRRRFGTMSHAYDRAGLLREFLAHKHHAKQLAGFASQRARRAGR